MQPVIQETVPSRAASPPAAIAGAVGASDPGGGTVRPVAEPSGPVAPALGPLANAALIMSGGYEGLTPEELALIEQLSARDREVRAHEEAHARVGGPHAGEPTYDFQAGPDGRRYAIGGSVAIDLSPVKGDPEATVAKMEVVKAAALAPAEPSGADRSIAARAEAIRLQALSEIAEQRREMRESLLSGVRGPLDVATKALKGMARAVSEALTPPAVDRAV